MGMITIDDAVLSGHVGLSRQDYRTFLLQLQSEVTSKLNGDYSRLDEAVKQAEHTALMFIGAYRAMQREISSKGLFQDDALYREKFGKIYSAYIASEATLQFLDADPSISPASTSLRRRQKPINLSTDNFSLTADVVEQMGRRITNPHSVHAIRLDLAAYFSEIASDMRDEINYFGYQKCADQIRNLRVKVSKYTIEGIKKPEKAKSLDGEARDPNDMFNQKLEEYTFSPVGKKEIVGNQKAILHLEEGVQQLLLYDKSTQMNPFLEEDGGFLQKFLLMGDSGVGKTLTARYAMTLAKNIAKKSNIDLIVTQADFENSWENGPYLALQNIIRQISKGDKSYIVFLDEIDTKFASRAERSNLGHRQTLGALLRWLDGGEINKGNYILIATSNKPGTLDPALQKRFGEGAVHVEGPKTVEEMARAYYVFLENGMKAGYVKVRDLRSVAELSHSRRFKGRDIQQVTKKVKARSRRNRKFPSEVYNFGYSKKKKWIRNNREVITEAILEEEVRRHFETEMKGRDLTRSFHEVGGRR